MLRHTIIVHGYLQYIRLCIENTMLGSSLAVSFQSFRRIHTLLSRFSCVYSSPLSLLHQLVFFYLFPHIPVPSSCCTTCWRLYFFSQSGHPLSSSVSDLLVHYPLNSHFQLIGSASHPTIAKGIIYWHQIQPSKSSTNSPTQDLPDLHNQNIFKIFSLYYAI